MYCSVFWKCGTDRDELCLERGANRREDCHCRLGRGTGASCGHHRCPHGGAFCSQVCAYFSFNPQRSHAHTLTRSRAHNITRANAPQATTRAFTAPRRPHPSTLFQNTHSLLFPGSSVGAAVVKTEIRTHLGERVRGRVSVLWCERVSE